MLKITNFHIGISKKSNFSHGILKKSIFFHMAFQKINFFQMGFSQKSEFSHGPFQNIKKKNHKGIAKKVLVESMVLYLKEHGESI